MLEPDPETSEFTLTRLNPGATVEEAREAAGWPLKVADDLPVQDAPTDTELTVLRELKATIDNGGTK